MEFKDIKGKKVTSSKIKKSKYSDKEYLLLEFSDGSKCTISACELNNKSLFISDLTGFLD